MAFRSEIIYLGEGTKFVRGLKSSSDNYGVITGYLDSGAVSAAKMREYAYHNLFPSTFPGPGSPTLPLQTIEVKGFSGGGKALITARYHIKSGGFENVTIAPSLRSARSWKDLGGLADALALSGRPIEVAQLQITWRADLETTAGGVGVVDFDLTGKINKNQYTISGPGFSYVFAPNTLRYDGTSVVSEYFGEFQRWVAQYQATYDSASWQDGALDGDGNPASVNRYTNDMAVVFPSLP